VRTICLTDQEFTIIDHALRRALAAAQGQLNRFRAVDEVLDADAQDELEWLTRWAELSVAQQRSALASLRALPA
jgi:hypothetical protein